MTCQNVGFTRPRFFAGQLLTDEDLQLLGDYVDAKNRLHSRALFGSGVVCGLEVVCQPCGMGHVIVKPGYALDCCGNDIVVSCSQELDINAMVRDLKLRLNSGYDCGDPCADSAAGASGRYIAGSKPLPASAGEARHRGNGAREYCLYISYCEQPSDPVSPYATDSPCVPQACEPTRIREGFRFELRCADKQDSPPAICSRFWDCIGDPTALERTTVDSEHLRIYGAEAVHAVKALRDAPAPLKPEAFAAELEQHLAHLAREFGEFKEVGEREESPELRPVLAAVRVLGRDVARLRIQTVEMQERLLGVGGVRNQIREAEGLMARVRKTITPAEIRKFMETALERAHAAALLWVVHRLAEQEPAELQEAAGGEVPAEDARQVKPIVIRDIAVQALAYGAVWSPDLQSAAADSLAAIRAWLLEHMEQSQNNTHCDLLCEVEQIALPPPTSRSELTLDDLRTFGNAAAALARAVREVLRGCLCNALNPPCQSCDDPGVLLACLTVEDCRVIDICNLERKIVVSPVSIAYWIPEVQRVGEAIERWCCDCEEEIEECEPRGVEENPLIRAIGPINGYAMLPLLMIARGCPEPRKHTALLANLPLDSLAHVLRSVAGYERPALAGERGVTVAAPRVHEESQREARSELERKLADTYASLESVRADYASLAERLSVLEKKQPARK
ncbi:hypothetical protein [Paraburkholderia sp. BR14374]|uniref:hypothetical protein n=1 Tax=Paraburkholderia sp. BR14374 TaxID=3237007 RepID=UPI0034CFC6D8